MWHTTSPSVCAVCRTRITRIQPSGLWIHARAPRPWHRATPASIDSTKD